MWREYLDEALAEFSGYIAADELYDGPFCVLSIVDNRRFRRLVYEVLDRNPTKEDVERLFRRFKGELDSRGLSPWGRKPLRRLGLARRRRVRASVRTVERTCSFVVAWASRTEHA